MKNIQIEKTGDVLTIKINLNQTQGPSKSGKTTVIASTQGNVTVPGTEGVKLGVNCYKGMS